jgi:uroporphyrin-III C-methyltransferase/precorrin-2 dehydrogenase/sirohydrochlorin ferrochelatase
LRELLNETMRDPGMASGSLLLIDAGSGDPARLTLGALRALQSADVILFDEGVSADVLDLARREAKRRKVRNIESELVALHKLVTDAVGCGEQIVWLASDDPVKPRGAHGMLDACRNAGVHVEAIPGINQLEHDPEKWGAGFRKKIMLKQRARAG